MASQHTGPDLPTSQSLRRSLLGAAEAGAMSEYERWKPEAPPAGSAAAPTAARPAPAAHAAAPAPTGPPTPQEVLGASPAVVRLCESYHRSLATMVTRSRRQRIGLAFLVSGLAVGATLLSRSGTVTAALVSDLVLAVAGSSCASLFLLALLWLRDQRQLRALQGERLLRALQSNCSLPNERIAALRGREPVSMFFDCYTVWRARYHMPQSRLATLVATFKGTDGRSAA